MWGWVKQEIGNMNLEVSLVGGNAIDLTTILWSSDKWTNLTAPSYAHNYLACTWSPLNTLVQIWIEWHLSQLSTISYIVFNIERLWPLAFLFKVNPTIFLLQYIVQSGQIARFRQHLTHEKNDVGLKERVSMIS